MKGDTTVDGNLMVNGNISLDPLTIVDHNSEEIITFDGNESKTLILTKDIFGLENVDNIADVDKSVKYANSAEYAYGLKRRQDDKSYVTYGFIGSDPYSSIGNTDEEIWVQGSSIWLRGDTVVSGSLTLNGGISLNKLIVKNYNSEEILKFDGNEEKTLILTKDIVGLNNVDNTADADKTVKHSNTSSTAYKLVNGKGNAIAGSY